LKCELIRQDAEMGDCLTMIPGNNKKIACEAALRKDKNGVWQRLIKSAHLSRPEHYYSIYMSGCNMNCRKCHSHEFTKEASGQWMTTDQIAELCAEYRKQVTVYEPRERALDWYASDLCRCCGYCLLTGRRSFNCPGVLEPHQILLSPQGFGPARNIVGYTGGDLGCCVDFYVDLTRKIKTSCPDLWILYETNGYGLTNTNLRKLREAGVDSFWLDIKAFEPDIHKKLCGVDNSRILELPSEMLQLGFQLEVLSLFIPGWVETDQLTKIALLLVKISPEIPFTLLAFFPEYRMMNVRPPNTGEMIESYHAVKKAGLKNVRIGNIGVFAKTEKDREILRRETGM